MLPTHRRIHKAEHNAITELAELPQWVAWRYQPRDTGKPAKQPINPSTGEPASATDPGTWGSFHAATEAVNRYGCAGVGFVFSDSDPYSGVDLDNCLDRGELAPWAARIIAGLASYAEVSPSGTGVKLWVRAGSPGERHTTHLQHGGKVEIYNRRRFFTFTGQRLGDTNTMGERPEELREVYRSVFGPDPTPEAVSGQRRTPQSIPAGDSELLEKARTGGAEPARFRQLFDRGYTQGADRSDEDFNLCQMLAYWTGKDADRIERLFSQSALGRREKWRTRTDYRRDTIRNAIRATRKTYDPDYGKGEQATTNNRRRIERAAKEALVFDWSGRGGDTDRDVFRALLRIAYRANSLTVDTGARQLAEDAGTGKNTASKAVHRLIDKHGLVRLVRPAAGTTAATYRLNLDALGAHPKVVHSTDRQSSIEGPSIDNNTRAYRACVPVSGESLRDTVWMRNPYNPPRKRFDKNGRPHPNYTGPALKRLGKRCGLILDLVHACGTTPVLIKELAELTGIRRDHLKARYIKPLLGAGLIEQDERGGYTTPADVEGRLDRELEDSGCVEAERLQRQRHRDEQEAYRTRHRDPAGRVPSQEEMDANRNHREALQSADGTTGELEHFHVPLTPEDAWGRSGTADRTCRMVDGIAVHDDPLCDDDCDVAFGTKTTQTSREAVA